MNGSTLQMQVHLQKAEGSHGRALHGSATPVRYSDRQVSPERHIYRSAADRSGSADEWLSVRTGGAGALTAVRQMHLQMRLAFVSGDRHTATCARGATDRDCARPAGTARAPERGKADRTSGWSGSPRPVFWGRHGSPDPHTGTERGALARGERQWAAASGARGTGHLLRERTEILPSVSPTESAQPDPAGRDERATEAALAGSASKPQPTHRQRRPNYERGTTRAGTRPVQQPRRGPGNDIFDGSGTADPGRAHGR
jgi:hypothetical protein